MKYVIIGHGDYPQYTKKTVEYLVGQRNDLIVISIRTDNNLFQSEVDELIDKATNEGLVIFTDILVGCATQYCVKKLENNDFDLIVGFNLALLLEIMLTPEMNYCEIADAVNQAKQQLVYCNELLNL